MNTETITDARLREVVSNDRLRMILADMIQANGDAVEDMLAECAAIRPNTLAKLIDCPQETVRYWLRTKMIPYHKVGGRNVVIRIRDLLAMMEAGKVGVEVEADRVFGPGVDPPKRKRNKRKAEATKAVTDTTKAAAVTETEPTTSPKPRKTRKRYRRKARPTKGTPAAAKAAPVTEPGADDLKAMETRLATMAKSDKDRGPLKVKIAAARAAVTE